MWISYFLHYIFTFDTIAQIMNIYIFIFLFSTFYNVCFIICLGFVDYISLDFNAI